MKKSKLVLSFVALASLSSCALTGQLEIKGRYTHAYLEDNYYTENAFASSLGKELAAYSISSEHYANGSYSTYADATHNTSGAFDTTYRAFFVNAHYHHSPISEWSKDLPYKLLPCVSVVYCLYSLFSHPPVGLIPDYLLYFIFSGKVYSI